MRPLLLQPALILLQLLKEDARIIPLVLRLMIFEQHPAILDAAENDVGIAYVADQ